MINYTPPVYEISQNATGNYQIDVHYEPFLAKETVLNAEACKSSLFAAALIQKLALDGDREAVELRALYQAYRAFLESGEKQPFVSAYEKIDCKNKEMLIHHLMPGIEKTLQMQLPRMMYAAQEVKINELTAKHLAFPDLIKFNGAYYATFREANLHVGYQDFGKIRVLKGDFNKEKHAWHFENAGLIAKEGIDLRDPRFFVDGENVLRIIIGGSKVNEKDETTAMIPHVAAFKNQRWEIAEVNADSQANGPTGQWIWRVTWNPKDNHGYAFAYGKNTTLTLVKTADGLNFKKIADLTAHDLTDLTEATIRFKADGEGVALIRTRRNGVIAVARPEDGYTKWTSSVIPFRVGGPNFVITKDEKMWAATRYYFLNEDNSLDESTIIAAMDQESLTPLLRLKGQSDGSYPAMVLEDDGSVTVMYYASPEDGVCRVYITRVSF